MSKTVTGIMVLIALAVLASQTRADESPLLLVDHTQSAVIDSTPGDWSFRAGANIWAAAITGNAGKGRTEVDLDAGLGEIFENGTWGLEFTFEADNGPWSILFDGLWLHLGDDPQAARGLKADFDGDFGFLDIAGGYELKRFTLRGKQAAIDGLLGFRWTRVDTSTQVKEGPTPRPKSEDNKDFLDPYIGVRGRWYLSDKYSLISTFTVGGLSIGSELLATGQIVLEYRFNDTWSIQGGYRAYYYDYDDNYDWNVTMHGPVFGVAARF